MANTEPDSGFLQRWSRRKTGARSGQPLPETPPPPPASHPPEQPQRMPAPTPAHGARPVPAQARIEPPPTLEEAAALTPASDFTRFVAPGVGSDVRNAALKKLFADPHFNVMDGLDTYIEDFGKPDVLPLGMLRKLAQAELLDLFAHEKKTEPQAAPMTTAPTPQTPADENPDLRLQPHDAAESPGPEPGLGAHARSQR